MKIMNLFRRNRHNLVGTAQTSGPVRLAGRYPLLGNRAALYAAVVPPSQRTPAGGACAIGVYLRTGPDRYRGYTLEGGP
jgi:hypothetical protein